MSKKKKLGFRKRREIEDEEDQISKDYEEWEE